jgi:hypothetical protein
MPDFIASTPRCDCGDHVNPMNLSVPSHRHASKAYATLTRAPGSRNRDAIDPIAEWPADPVGRGIGSLPINALAIALALMARVSEANRDPA